MFCGSSCSQTTSCSVRVAAEDRGDVLGRERIELLDAARWPRPASPARALARHQVDVDLAAAQHQPARRRGRGRAPRRRRSPAASGLRPARAATRRPSGGAAGSSASARSAAADRSSSSSAWRRSRWKYCAAVVQLARRRLMSAAGSRKRSGRAARVIRPLAFVAVRQQEHQRRRQAPLGAPRGDELVDDHLRAVDEVAVLRLPDDQPARLLDVVAELEADRGVLGERAVADLEGRPRLRQRLQRDVTACRCSTSWKTAWRWLNVPRSTSSPVRRIGMPSARIEANASSSAVAQSIVRSSGLVEHHAGGARGRDRACGAA